MVALTLLFLGYNSTNSQYQKPPEDTSYMKTIITKVNEKAYIISVDSSGSKSLTIIVPEGAKAGDTLLGYNMWDGVSGVFLQAQQTAKETKTDLDELKIMLQGLDESITKLLEDTADTN